MIAQIISFINSNQLIHPNDTIIAAVSGGVDSMVLLSCLNTIKGKLQFNLEVLHVHHGLRGKDADKDELLVQDVCSKLDLTFYSEKLSGFNLKSSEDDLRQARYNIFDVILQKHPNSKIATAHTLDDQLETFLMRLAKGSKLNGLCGIPVIRENFIRPFLFFKKSELIEYAEKHKILFREDFTNKDRNKTRNRIRHQIIPELISVFGNDFYTGFNNSWSDLNLVNSYLQDQIDQIMDHICMKTDDGLILNTRSYLSHQAKLRHLILESCVSGHYPLNFGIPSGYFLQFESFVRKAANGTFFEFRNGLRVVKVRRGLLFTDQKKMLYQEMELYPGDVVYTGNYEISLEESDKKQIVFKNDNSLEFICAENIQIPLKVRNWKKGDWFYPLGFKKRQKLSDFYINQKVEVNEKMKIPIITDKKNIVWIAGYRIDDRYKVTKTCKKIFKLELRSKSES